ncbi:MAG: exodeoxyribonuclease VII large subunit [Clostridia bacterium]|nr:exodeoxyribonuclease VII large subunit [Clostridia bacterium]
MPNDPKTAVFSVAQINEYIKYLIEDSPVLDSVYVVGEISNLTAYHTSGHMYFSLKDESGVLRAVMFKSSAMRLKFRPENGMRVIVHGRVTVYAPSGQYQISCDTMEPDGFGALAAAFEQLKSKLGAEGLFDEARKKPIPAFPRAVGVITSPTGAAVRDIINILTRRSPTTKMVLFPTLVQGDGAPKQLSSGIRYFNKYRTVDVIIIGRGGGSLEELWAFNDETLARTIADSAIPVISAVGHETDFTICDFVSDLRAPTPSAAAELAVPDSEALRHKLTLYRDALDTHIRTKLKTDRMALQTLAAKRVLQTPDSFLQNRRMDVDALTARLALSGERRITEASRQLEPLVHALQHAMEKRLHDDRARFLAQTAKLDALNPLSVLTRGYSAVFDDDGHALRTVADMHIGQTVHLRLSDGTADAAVLDLHTEKEQTHA